MPATCDDCGSDFFVGSDRCPHCGRPSRFPNVEAAREPVEREALAARYKAALDEAATRHLAAELRQLEEAVKDAKVVFARFVPEVERLAHADNELYATWYNLLDGGLRLPTGGKWDVLRVAADGAVFVGYGESIRFGTLSINDRGLTNYGECFLVARGEMVEHRTSLFEENTVTFLIRRGWTVEQLPSLPPGFRAQWIDRVQLVVAKLAKRLSRGISLAQIADLISLDGSNETDEFIEAHVFGPMTIRTFERVVWPEAKLRSLRVRVLRQKLGHFGIGLDIR